MRRLWQVEVHEVYKAPPAESYVWAVNQVRCVDLGGRRQFTLELPPEQDIVAIRVAQINRAITVEVDLRGARGAIRTVRRSVHAGPEPAALTEWRRDGGRLIFETTSTPVTADAVQGEPGRAKAGPRPVRRDDRAEPKESRR